MLSILNIMMIITMMIFYDNIAGWSGKNWGKLTSTIFLAFPGRRPVAFDPTWMAIIIAPGAGVNHGVAILLSQVALPSPALDQIRSWHAAQLLWLLTWLSGKRIGNHGVHAESKHQSNGKGEVKNHVNRATRHDGHMRHNSVGICCRLDADGKAQTGWWGESGGV